LATAVICRFQFLRQSDAIVVSDDAKMNYQLKLHFLIARTSKLPSHDSKNQSSIW
jgi:hypothetical protein